MIWLLMYLFFNITLIALASINGMHKDMDKQGMNKTKTYIALLLVGLPVLLLALVWPD